MGALMIDLNLSKSIQSAAGLKALKACCQWAILNVQIIILLFTFTAHKYILNPSVIK